MVKTNGTELMSFRKHPSVKKTYLTENNSTDSECKSIDWFLYNTRLQCKVFQNGL